MPVAVDGGPVPAVPEARKGKGEDQREHQRGGQNPSDAADGENFFCTTYAMGKENFGPAACHVVLPEPYSPARGGAPSGGGTQSIGAKAAPARGGGRSATGKRESRAAGRPPSPL